jgi:hypothetical protein
MPHNVSKNFTQRASSIEQRYLIGQKPKIIEFINEH